MTEENYSQGRDTPIEDFDDMCSSPGTFIGYSPISHSGDFTGFTPRTSPIAWLDDLDNSDSESMSGKYVQADDVLTEIDDGNEEESVKNLEEGLNRIEKFFSKVHRPRVEAKVPKKVRRVSKQGPSLAPIKIKREPHSGTPKAPKKLKKNPTVDTGESKISLLESMLVAEVPSVEKTSNLPIEITPITPETNSEEEGVGTAEDRGTKPGASEASAVEIENIQFSPENDSPEKSDSRLAKGIGLERELKISIRKSSWDRSPEIIKGVEIERDPEVAVVEKSSETVPNSAQADDSPLIAAARDPNLPAKLVLTPLPETSPTAGESEPSPVQEPVVEEEPSNSAYFAPFSCGWKRELYFMLGRVNVVYIHPLGLQLRDMEDVSQHLTHGLTLENFTFLPEPLGADESHEVTIPEPKIEPTPPTPVEEVTSPVTIPNSLPAVRKSGRIPVPSSNYKLQDKLDTPSRKSVTERPQKKDKVVLKIKQYPPTPVSENVEAVTPAPPLVITQNGRGHKVTPRKIKTKKPIKRTKKNTKLTSGPSAANCTMMCPLATGQVPSLQCSVCLCLYHPECAGVSSFTPATHNYVCKNCRGPTEPEKIATAPVAVAPAGKVTSPMEGAPYPFPYPPPPAVPQFFITLPDNRRFIVVPNLSLVPPAPDTQPQPPEAPPKKLQKAKRRKDGGERAVDVPLSPLGISFSSYSPILHAVKYLSIPDRLRVAQVCKFLRQLCMDPSLWETVEIFHPISNWNAFAATMVKTSTRVLDLTNMPSNYTVEQWQSISKVLNTVPSLETIRMPTIPAPCCQSVMRGSGLKNFQCSIAQIGGTLTLAATENPKLEEIKIKCTQFGKICALQLTALQASLTKLSLLRCDWKNVNVESLKELIHLTDLEFGDCTFLPANFPAILRPLQNLESVRLESCNKTCPTVDIINTLTLLPNLRQLELVNFDASQEIESSLAGFKYLQSLLLIPKFDNQSATKTSAVLKGVYHLKETLKSLVWVCTLEIQVTDTSSLAKKQRMNSTESGIPILMPPPIPSDASHPLWSGLQERYSADISYAVIQLDELQNMLNAALPNTRSVVTKTHYINTINVTLKSVLG